MTYLFSLLFLFSIFANADDIKVKASAFDKPARLNDTLTVTEECSAKNLPLNEPDVKIEKISSQGIVSGIGGKVSRFSLSKGNTTIYQTVLGETTLEDFKKGNFRGTEISGKGGCHRQTIFRLVAPDDQCNSTAGRTNEPEGKR